MSCKVAKASCAVTKISFVIFLILKHMQIQYGKTFSTSFDIFMDFYGFSKDLKASPQGLWIETVIKWMTCSPLINFSHLSKKSHILVACHLVCYVFVMFSLDVLKVSILTSYISVLFPALFVNPDWPQCWTFPHLFFELQLFMYGFWKCTTSFYFHQVFFFFWF